MILGAVFYVAQLLCGAEIFLADCADLADEIIGKVFPLHAGLFFVVDPAANVANVFHCFFSFHGEFAVAYSV